MLIRSSKIFLVLLLASSIGLHWELLQTVAWTTMLANNLRTQSLTEAVSYTFDGNHPCPLCRAIAAAKKSENKNGFDPQTQKLEFPPLAPNFVLIAPAAWPGWSLTNSSVKSRTQEPPRQPPRSHFI